MSIQRPRRPLTTWQRRRWMVWVGLFGVTVAWSWWTMIRMPGKSYEGPWQPLSQRELLVRDELRNAVTKLAEEIGERNVFHAPKLNEAQSFLEGEFRAQGYVVTTQTYRASGELCGNVVAEKPGRAAGAEIVVVGAHYDSVAGCPGANDNGTGVAALLALARLFRDVPTERTLRWVAFANEEPPFFQTDLMGSQVYAQLCRRRNDPIAAMISLETMGYYSDAPRSQSYPFPLSLFYPSQGNFIAWVGNTSSQDLVRRCVRIFRDRVPFPSEGAALPAILPGVGWSDHWAFWQAGYKALMITDTAPFRYPHYHTDEDTPDKLDYERLARVVCGVYEVILDLATPGKLGEGQDKDR